MSGVARRRTARKPPLVGTRVAGYRGGVDGDSPIFSSRGSFGELGDNLWYRVRLPSQYVPGPWSVRTEVLGEPFFVSAVIDDFGNLVRVPDREGL